MSEALATILSTVGKTGSLLLKNGGVLLWLVPCCVVGYAFDVVLKVFRRIRSEREWVVRQERVARIQAEVARRIAERRRDPGGWFGRNLYTHRPEGWSAVEWRAYQYVRRKDGKVSWIRKLWNW